jgi:hypothetical protein
MKRIFTAKMMGLAVSVIALVALAGMATSATGAYFSDTKAGAVNGTGGSIKVAAGANSDMGGGLNFSWSHMLPGEVYSATAYFQNSGDSAQDVYLTFPNLTALSALNNLGRYGAVKIFVNGSQVYYNDNLNDYDNNGTTGVPSRILLASNVGPTGSGTVTFQFQYASQMTAGNGTGFAFNNYPVAADPLHIDKRNAEGFGQKTVIASDGSSSGLPFAIVATQHGILPGAAGGVAGF